VKTKEMSFRPGTSDHDMGHKVKKVREFLEGGDRVKLIVKFRGREMAHQDQGPKILDRVLTYCPGAVVSTPTRIEGRTASMIIVKRR
jgi:translation initiation factor IF-3